MVSPASTGVLDLILDPVGRCLDVQVSQRLLALRADPSAQRRIEELARKSTEGSLTADERLEYETYVAAGNFIAILQAKARHFLTQSPAT